MQSARQMQVARPIIFLLTRLTDGGRGALPVKGE
jgi:hypothetical protein